MTTIQFQANSQGPKANNLSPGNAPKGFVENRGQLVDSQGDLIPEVLFKFESNGVDVYLTKTGISYVYTRFNLDSASEKDPSSDPLMDRELTYTNDKYRSDLVLVGTNTTVEVIKESRLAHYFNYYYSHCPSGITQVRSYGKVTYKEIYPNIDWVLYAYPGEKGTFIKYDFIVHPGGEPKDIQMIYEGVEDIVLTKNGEISISNTLGRLVENTPYVHQKNEEIESNFVLDGHEVSFKIGSYDLDDILVIDPILDWSTFYGANSGEIGRGVSVDHLNNILLIGETGGGGFPVFSGFQMLHAGSMDAFIAKFDSNGVLAWCTYYGGDDVEWGDAITSDSLNSVIALGRTQSLNLPILNAFQDTLSGFNRDNFIVKFDQNGIMQWATYYGGTLKEYGRGITTDPWNRIIAVGQTESPNLMVLNAFQSSKAGIASDAFLLQLDPNGAPIWSTYFGGATGFGTSWAGTYAVGVDCDALGNIAIAGWTNCTDLPIANAYQDSLAGTNEAFVAKFSPSGNRIWCTYYGGTSVDFPYGMTVDTKGNLVLAGYTQSLDLSMVNSVQPYHGGGILDVFLAKFDSVGGMVWSTYFGGIQNDWCRAVSSDQCNNIYFTGFTGILGSFYPVLNAYQDTFAGFQDTYVTKLDELGNLVYSTYLGGTDNDQSFGIVADYSDNVIVTGYTESADFPTLNAHQNAYVTGNDVFLYKFSDSCCLPLNILSMAICLGDSVLLSGTYQDTAGIYYDTLMSSNNCDSIIATILSIEQINNTDSMTICNGDSVLLGGSFQAIAGIYYDSLQSMNGCDSIVTVTLFVDSSYSQAQSIVICSGDSALIAGTYQYLPGTYNDSLVALTGCDSVIEVTLTLDSSYLVPLSVAICPGDSVFIAGTFQSNSGVYYDSLSTIRGCDSVIATALTIYSNYVIPSTVGICSEDSIFLSGNYQNTSGIYVDTLVSIDGCDSVVNTTLTVDSIITNVLSINMCVGDSMFLGGSYQTMPGTYSDTLGAANGCDSLVETTLFIYPTYLTQDSVYLCFGDSLQIGGQYHSTTGIYYDSLLTVLGCDSVNATQLKVDSVYSNLLSESICTGDSILLTGEYQTIQGTYVDTLLSVNGCDSLITTSLTVTTVPTAYAGRDDTICIGVSTKLSGSGASGYSWAPSESLSNSSTSNPIASPDATTNYTLTVFNGNCSDEDTVIITVLQDCSMYIADIFSPNEDGNNDKLHVQGRGIVSIWFIIYDRWGRKIFETTDINRGWDGSYKGNSLNSGVYVYYVEIVFTNGVRQSEQGDVTLVR